MRPVPNESKIPVGTLLAGKYKVTREIGRGGMAAVYEAEQIALGKKVAVKVLASELASSNIVIERFFREARAAASVRSPYIVDVYDSGRLEDGRPFIAMEMLEGESLYDRMSRVRLIDPHTTARIINHCAKGLMKAHAAGIVHRDLKPENIFLTRGEDGADEVAKLLDFGLAKFYAPVAADEKTARLTREGAVFGTPAYMSPEQVKGQGNVDHRADLWALGCMAYECLIGRPVWNTDQGVAMTFAAIATQPIPVPSHLRPDLPATFDAWFAKALERDPDKRFQTAKELSDALAKAFGGAGAPVSYINVSDLEEIEAEPIPPPHTSSSGDQRPVLAIQPSMVSAADSSQPGPSPSSSRSSTVEMPPTASTPALPEKKTSPLRYAFSVILLLGGGAAAFYAWDTQLRPQVLTPMVISSVTATAAPTTSSSSAAPTAELPKWDAPLLEAQQLYSSGDPSGAQKKLKEVADAGASSLSKAFQEQMKAGAAGTGTCKMVVFSQPRLGLATNVGRPAITMGLRAPIVVWTDDHERPGHDHAYSVMLDAVGHPMSAPRDVSPEASEVWRPALLAAADRTALLYWDKSGRESGVRVRWLDSDGRIAGGNTLVGAGRGGMFWPAMERTPEGFVVVWQDDRDKEGDDLFLRKLNAELEPIGPELRLTDYVPGAGSKSVNVRVPSVAVASNAVFVVYKLERDTSHLVMRMRLALDSKELTTGLEEIPPGSGRLKKDRELGDTKLVNEDKLPADAPSVACGTEGCFVAWHGEKSGAYAALIEPAQGKVLWRKNFAPSGGHPSLGVGVDGQVMLAYYEKGTIRVAPITRDGVGAPSVFARTGSEISRPWIAAGKVRGEWLIAWMDAEGNHSEVFAAKLQCP